MRNDDDDDAGDKIIPKEFFNNLLGFVVGKCQVIELSRSLSGRYPEGIDRWLVCLRGEVGR